MKKIPFAVDRHSPTSLTEQVADGFRRSIQVGRYKVGETLPIGNVESVTAAAGGALLVTGMSYPNNLPRT